MLLAARLAVAVVALLHVQFLVMEMFLWQTPTGRKVFRTTVEQAEATAVLAKNQGLYNGFLAAGLGWGLWLSLGTKPHANEVITFFLLCVVIAGIYGAATASKNILLVQALPAVIALALLLTS